MSGLSLPGPEVADLPMPVLSHRVGAAGLCSDSNDNWWFPAEPDRDAAIEERLAVAQYARAACLGCTVQRECLELALRIEALPWVRSHGVWGGLASWERDALRRRRRDRARRAAVKAVAS
jgi:hypothetical protein